MARDFYAILGVMPTSEDVVIRAAYRALMRRYHPDADPSSEASQRAQAINATYAVLSDPEKRARYDGSLAAQGLIRPDPRPARSTLSFIPRPGPAAAVGFAALAAAMVAIAAWQPLGELPGLPSAAERAPVRAVAADEATTAAGASVETADLCGNRAASGLIRDEIFRRAARLRAGDSTEIGRIASLAAVRIESVGSRNSQAGAAGCHGFVALDLPPGLVVDGGRTNLTAEIGYGLVETAGSGLRLASLTGANGIVRSLATLSAEPPQAAPVVEPVAPVQVAVAVPTPVRRTEAAASKPSPSPGKPVRPKLAAAGATAKPDSPANQTSFNCKAASAAAEKTICGSSNLAGLDRQAALLYKQSWGQANEAKRAALLQTRVTFVDKRNKCGSEACLTSAYVARMREISDIMAGRAKP